jgi:hypothetical protein
MKTFMMTLFAVCMGMAACSTASTDASEDAKPAVASEPTGTWRADTAEEAAARASSPGDAVDTSDGEAVTAPTGTIEPRANCSIVQFCNAPGSDGSRCIQQGCSLADAEAECQRETVTVCGAPTCPWALVETNGTKLFEHGGGFCP